MHKLIALFAFLGISLSAWSQPPHMDLDMTSREYRALLEQHRPFAIPLTAEDQALDQYLAWGQKALSWVDLVNSSRPPEKYLSLSSPGTAGGATTSRPSYLSFKIIKEDWDVLHELLPMAYSRVIFGGAALTTEVPGSDRDFVEWLRQVDKLYQWAARYRMLTPWKQYYISAAAGDVRGYLHLKEVEGLDAKLRNWGGLLESEKAKLKPDLVLICANQGGADAGCANRFESAVTAGKVLEFKNEFYDYAKEQYEAQFKMAWSHDDGQWTNDNLFNFPFTDPGTAALSDFLKVNIEDEWKWGSWQLRLDFRPKGEGNHTHLEFEPGATPHAGGNVIVMDANAPLSEYEVAWAIRHEFGHILGFPDCYQEFYDVKADAFINFQLDVTNLMCSRRGHIKQIHFDEMKRVYSR